MGLIAGRHDMPVDEYIWDGPMEGGLKEHLGRLKQEADDWLEDREIKELHLYITGYTPALTAFLRAWNNRGKLVMYHYDTETKEYLPEEY